MAKESSKPQETAASAQTNDARSLPHIPGATPRAEPPVPLKAKSVKPQTEVIYRNMLGAQLKLEEPAQGYLSAIATRRWGELSMELGLGTSRPPRAHVGLDESKQFLYLAPTTKDDPHGLEVKYGKRGNASINLSKAFVPADRYVTPGRLEYYNVNITPGKVLFDDGFESVALYAYLVAVKEEPRRSMSDEAKAKLRATLARKKQAQQEQAPAAQGPGEEQE